MLLKKGTKTMPVHRWSDIRQKRFTPEQLRAIDDMVEEELLAMDLRTCLLYTSLLDCGQPFLPGGGRLNAGSVKDALAVPD